METALALVHSRFSTNTFPSWDRSHPYRYIAHNGEINTLRGNINWMKAREALFDTDVFGDDVKKILPIINPNGSDSAMFDNTLELLVLAGRSLPHAVMMMIPEPWSNHEQMDDSLRAFYEYHSSLMEPWDGPACIAFTDGRKIGAVLDRNGLRPSRYYVTKDDMVVMASEAGVLDLPPEDILSKGRLQPGRMFLVDTEAGRIVEDEEIKRQVASERPYRQWLDEHLVHLEDLPAAPEVPVPDHDTLMQRQIAFGYTFEDLRVLLTPMAKSGVEAVGSMGNDAALAALSSKPRLLYDYFKQLFAQVTNPPIDCIREELITASEVWLGSEGNLLMPQPADCRRLELQRSHPHQRGVRQGPAPAGAGTEGRRAVDPVPRHPRRARPGQVHRRAAPGGAAHGRGRGGQHPHPQRSRCEPRVCRRALTAGRLGAASLSDPRRAAHAGEPGAGDRRGARSASLLAAHRLWLQRHQPVPGVRDPGRHDPR